ncbi:hypothetical protein ACTG9Q_00720 [Actinokineospora sp. 24-640]
MRETVNSAVIVLRKRLSDRLARLIDFRIEQRLVPVDRRIDEQGHHHGACIDDHRRRLDEVERLQGWTANELERVIPQVASLEARLAAVDDLLAGTPVADGAELGQARSLIEEIRREHAQIRVRLTGVAQYEERLGRLEDQVADR